MSTPTGQQQQSSTATYSQAIQYLENARSRMTQVQMQVQDAKVSLQSHYQGPDGQAYSNVMDTWLSEVDRIKATCQAMENQLSNSMQASNNVQGHNFDAVLNQAKLNPFGGSVGNGAYNVMTGG